MKNNDMILTEIKTMLECMCKQLKIKLPKQPILPEKIAVNFDEIRESNVVKIPKVPIDDIQKLRITANQKGIGTVYINGDMYLSRDRNALRNTKTIAKDIWNIAKFKPGESVSLFTPNYTDRKTIQTLCYLHGVECHFSNGNHTEIRRRLDGEKPYVIDDIYQSARDAGIGGYFILHPQRAWVKNKTLAYAITLDGTAIDMGNIITLS